MTNKTLVFWVTRLILLAAIAWFSWQMAIGVLVGASIAIYIYQRRYSIVDEVEAEVSWVKNWEPGKLEEYGEGYTRWHGAGRPLVIIILLVAVILLIVFMAG